MAPSTLRDDWAQDRDDIEVIDEAGTVLARKRLPVALRPSRDPDAVEPDDGGEDV